MSAQNDSIKGNKKLVKVGNYMMTGHTLGKGHFARVKEAFHVHLNVKVAVKILTFREVKDEYIIKNMRREAKILSKVSHPNIVYLFETITTTKRYYIITELITGGDLCTYVMSQPNGKLSEKQTRPLARQIISAVAHLHERGIVHRDLKMQNILLDNSKENVKLVDFGLSNYRHGAELLHTHCGSPEYAAPELYISGRQYGPEVDIWSLGVIFYGMLVGKLPFQSWHKPGLTPDAKRKQLIRETKIGLTNRHLKNLMSVSLLFRNLIERMLCPSSTDRITMSNLQTHAWIYGRFCREYPQVDGAWKRMALSKISKMCDLPAQDICRTIETKRYSPIAGLFNILKFIEIQRRLELEQSKEKTKEISKSKTSLDMSKVAASAKHPKDQNGDDCKSRPRSFSTEEQPNKQNNVVSFKPNKYNQTPQKPKAPFTLGPSSTTPRKKNMDYETYLSKMFPKKNINRSSDVPPTKPQIIQEKKIHGIPMHTAARAVARSEFDKKTLRRQ